MDSTTERISAYIAGLRYEDLPRETVHCAKRCLIDAIGCALGAFHSSHAAAMRELASRVTSTSPATVIGTAIRSSPEWAGFVNGFMIRYSDFSDDYFGGNGMQSGPHPSDNIGSVLAIAESLRGDGRRLILGTVAAYEACNLIVDHAVLHPPNGWDYPIMHSIGTAMGAGKLMDLDQKTLAHALGLAIVPNVCLWQTRLGQLSVWKGMAGPNGSRNGLMAAMLAQAGITGPSEPFEGKAGFMKQLECEFTLGELGGRGVPFRIERTCFKYLPVMYSLQLPIWAALELRRRVRLADVVSIVAYVDAHVYHTDAFAPDRWDPQTRESADHSGPYLMAAALVDGEITGRTMEPARYRDAGIAGVMRKISVRMDGAYADFPRTLECRLEATLASGEVVVVRQANPKGHPANPMSDGDIERKFLRQAEPLLAGSSAAVVETLWHLETVDDLGRILALMEVPPQAS